MKNFESQTKNGGWDPDSQIPPGQKEPQKKDVAAIVRDYLGTFDGGVFKISDLKRELGFTDKEYTLARQCVSRMAKTGEVEKHGSSLGMYRIPSPEKEAIDWNAVEAKPANIGLPGYLHKQAVIRAGDMVCFAGFKNSSKTAFACETVKQNIERFRVHFFITEYKSRMKDRLQAFGIDLYHQNLKCYQIEKSDYLPDKIESGEGVLNVIDHFPNVDNFYLVGKVQDEIHRKLDGAICVLTHQKLKENDNDAIGGSFWRITPTLAISLFTDESALFRHKMRIVKGKEPAVSGSIDGLELDYNLIDGHEFFYSKDGWLRR